MSLDGPCRSIWSTLGSFVAWLQVGAESRLQPLLPCEKKTLASAERTRDMAAALINQLDIGPHALKR